MKQFSEYLLEVSETKAVDSDELFRLDDCPLSRKAKSYDMDSSGSSSDKTGKLKHTHKVTGLFTDTLGDVVPYAAGRKTPFIMVVPLDKKIKGDVYFRNEDKKHIKSAKPILSQFSKKQGFKKLKSGEWFASGKVTPQPINQITITDTIAFMSKHLNVKFVADLSAIDKQIPSSTEYDVTRNNT